MLILRGFFSAAAEAAVDSSRPDFVKNIVDPINALKGDWTATATVKTYDYNTGKTSSAQKSWKVTIGDLSTNNALSAADYAVFEEAGVNKAAADAYCAEFNKLAANYNASVLGQNRVLCQGWDLSGTRETSTASPWDLFLMPDYNASLVDYLFNDFGPKWFLQTDADGNIFVPVNYNVVPTVMCWFNGLDHYLCAGNFEKGYANYYNPIDPMGVQSVGIPVEISADGNTVTLKAVTINAEGQMGVNVKMITPRTVEYGFFESIPAGIRRTGREIASYWDQLKMIVNPKTKSYKEVGGFIAIGNIFPSEWNWQSFWALTALLSVILAIMNILPIPGLDGGHSLFTLWEIITRRKPSEKFMSIAQNIGFYILMALLLYANGSDILRLFS